MPSYLSLRDGSLDEEALAHGAEIYFTHRSTEGKEEYKWEVFKRLEQWLDTNDVTEETVEEFVTKLQEENPEFPLVHWRHLDDLENAAEDNPQRLARLLDALFHGDADLATRIDAFREAIPIGSDGIGYLMAASDRERFAPYKDGMFQTFLAYFSGYREPSYESLGEKYALFCECLSLLANFFDQEGYTRSASVLDAQDFIYTIVIYDEPSKNYILRYLTSFARRLKSYEDDQQRLVEEIRDLPDPYLREMASKYEDREKIANVRYRVLMAILNGDAVELERYKREEAERFEKNIFNAWTDFRILAQLYFNLFKSRVDLYFDDLIDYLREELQAEELEAHIVTFQGSRNLPTTRSWFTLYPANMDFKSSYQFFCRISPVGVEYGLSPGSNIRDSATRDTDLIEQQEAISITTILEKYRTVKDKFEERNRELSGETSETSRRTPYDELDSFPEIVRQLKKSKQMIFYGPPGTGKTYTAVNFARWWVNEQDGDIQEQVESVTFHPSFTYEDFIEGLTAEAVDGSLAFDIDKGIFAKICKRASRAYEESDGTPPRYILVIDEINRGNLASIFGETITLLEADKRTGERGEMTITLAHSGESFSIPPNLYLIGTMNTADRSIALVDAALRRRFRFRAFPPNYDLLLDEYEFEDEADARVSASQQGGERTLRALSILALAAINRHILNTSALGRGKQVGHSYLLNRESEEAIVDAWRYEILPLLEEYYFGRSERLQTQIFNGNGDALFDWEAQRIREFSGEDLQSELQLLLDIEQ